ncbi:hypothetical protein [Parvularcula sp. IMCC14364]|uniref:hypothetical protein n=1 Tax=Parvularcula sp. IMCC14364 TaxID=3067902 RepID=UPI0027419020|nr:hypothetical protein [Parvularcula sp. IMCC14364]
MSGITGINGGLFAPPDKVQAGVITTIAAQTGFSSASFPPVEQAGKQSGITFITQDQRQAADSAASASDAFTGFSATLSLGSADDGIEQLLQPFTLPVKTSELLPDYVPLPPPSENNDPLQQSPQDMLKVFAEAYGALSNRTAVIESSLDLMI